MGVTNERESRGRNKHISAYSAELIPPLFARNASTERPAGSTGQGCHSPGEGSCKVQDALDPPFLLREDQGLLTLHNELPQEVPQVVHELPLGCLPLAAQVVSTIVLQPEPK